jgi:hypothetical protein
MALEALRAEARRVEGELEHTKRAVSDARSENLAWRTAARELARIAKSSRRAVEAGNDPGRLEHLEDDWKRLAPPECSAWQESRRTQPDIMERELVDEGQRSGVDSLNSHNEPLDDENENAHPNPTHEELAPSTSGEDYRYVYTNANTDERKRMPAWSCPDCALFYKHVGAPSNKQTHCTHGHKPLMATGYAHTAQELRDAGSRHKWWRKPRRAPHDNFEMRMPSSKHTKFSHDQTHDRQ